MVHGGDEIEDVAFGLAGKTLKRILLGVGVETVRALALVNGTPAAKFLAASLQLHAVVLQDLLDGHRLFDRFEVHPIAFHQNPPVLVFGGGSIGKNFGFYNSR